MKAHGFVLRTQRPAAKTPGIWLALRSLLYVGGLALILLLWLTPTMADPPPLVPPPSPPPANTAPIITMYPTYLGEGLWKITGMVVDDQSPVGLLIDLSGAPLGPPDQSEVVEGNGFTYYVRILVPGAIYAQTTDALGAHSNVAATLVGY